MESEEFRKGKIETLRDLLVDGVSEKDVKDLTLALFGFHTHDPFEDVLSRTHAG